MQNTGLKNTQTTICEPETRLYGSPWYLLNIVLLSALWYHTARGRPLKRGCSGQTRFNCFEHCLCQVDMTLPDLHGQLRVMLDSTLQAIIQIGCLQIIEWGNLAQPSWSCDKQPSNNSVHSNNRSQSSWPCIRITAYSQSDTGTPWGRSPASPRIVIIPTQKWGWSSPLQL